MMRGRDGSFAAAMGAERSPKRTGAARQKVTLRPKKKQIPRFARDDSEMAIRYNADSARDGSRMGAVDDSVGEAAETKGDRRRRRPLRKTGNELGIGGSASFDFTNFVEA